MTLTHLTIKQITIYNKTIREHNELKKLSTENLSEDQIKEKVKSFAGNYDNPEKAVKWFYEDKQRLSEPAALATEDNVVDWITSQCKKTKKT